MKTRPLHKDWRLTQEAFDAMLLCLDPDRERAGEKYEKIRWKLTKLFKWRGCDDPETFTDRTIDRAARRISEGADLRVNDPYLYFHGVALNVLREYWKEPQRENESFERARPLPSPAANPDQLMVAERERRHKEQMLECLSECLGKISTQDRALIASYHTGGAGEKKRVRQELARSLNIPLNALRIRVYRMRQAIQTCVEN